jgi:NADH-ubiquinone oxidoreductase chain 3
MNNILMLFIFVPILSLILLALNILLAPHMPYEAKVSAFECGINPVPGQTRSTFNINFFMVALLFLIFDLELLLFFPFAVTLSQVGVYGFVIALIFFVVLTIGFVLEIGSGAIKLTSLEVKDTNNKTTSSPLSSGKGNIKTANNLTSRSLVKRYYHSSNIESDDRSKTNIISKLHQQSAFLNWLCGFTDAEGHFAIKYNIKPKTVYFALKYHLHIDDINVLIKIKTELSLLAGKDIGRIYINKSDNACELSFLEFKVLRDLFVPIFKSYPLRTSKFLDFKDWEKAILLKNNSLKTSLSEETLTKILELKKGMNTGRTQVDENLILDGPILLRPTHNGY